MKVGNDYTISKAVAYICNTGVHPTTDETDIDLGPFATTIGRLLLTELLSQKVVKIIHVLFHEEYVCCPLVSSNYHQQDEQLERSSCQCLETTCTSERQIVS